MQKLNFSSHPYGIYILVLLTVLLRFLLNKFYINDIINVPQFEDVNNFGSIWAKVIDEGKEFYFYAFFIIDFVWAALLLYYAYRWLKSIVKNDKWAVLGKYIAILAYIADVAENFGYIFHNNLSFVPLKATTELKMNLYYAVGLILLFSAVSKYVFSFTSEIYSFIKTSLLSLLIVGIITLLVLFVAQGGTLMVDLFMTWWSLLIFFLLMNYLALILSHYPAYFQRNIKNPEFYQWKLKRWISWIPIGLVYYSKRESQKDNPEANEDDVVAALRKIMGLMFFVVWLIILRYIMVDFKMPFREFIDPALLAFSVWIIYYHVRIENLKYEWNKVKKLNTQTAKDLRKEVQSRAQNTPKLLVLLLILIVVSCFVVAFIGWHPISVIVVALTSIVNAVYFIHFRSFRSLMQDVFVHKNDHWEAHTKDNNKLHSYDDTEKVNHNPFNFEQKKLKGLLFKYLLLNNDHNVHYIGFLRAMFLLTCVFLLSCILNLDMAQALNPIVIILAYLIVAYGMIAILIKHLIYFQNFSPKDVKLGTIARLEKHKDEMAMKALNKTDAGIKDYTQTKKEVELEEHKLFPLRKNVKRILGGLMIILVLIIYGSSKGNDLHLLKPIPHKGTNITTSEFINSVPLQNKEGKEFRRAIQVSSYGGGLKAHLWTLLVLDKLQDISKGDFLQSTLSMSGVSGGSVGIGNYTQISKKYNYDQPEVDDLIEKFGMSNVLAVDIVGLLGRDMVREWLPVNWFNGKDRSFEGMKVYSKILEMNSQRFETYTFKDEWSEIFESKGYYPNLIINSTSTKSRYGVSSTIGKDKTFPGAIDIVNFEQDSLGLSYYNVVSTSNRFPFLSPAGRIPSKGHFVDGGYFENSGILSSNSFFKFYQEQRNDSIYKVKDSRKQMHVNIVNSKNKYIIETYDEFFVASDSIDQAEFSAILNTIAGTEQLPTYFIDKAKTDSVYYGVYLPHVVSYNEVCSVFSGKPLNSLELGNRIDSLNTKILEALAEYRPYGENVWGVVTPALSRLMSRPGYEYQKAMIVKHKGLNEQIRKIVDQM